MKQILPVIFFSAAALTAAAQQQIGNGDMETWEVVTGSSVEPTNWNSFLTAGGSVNWAASDQVSKSTDAHGGSFSCRINAKSTLGVIANGNITLGKINMGSASPTNSANYNSTIQGDANFSESFTDHPDSLVFWAKFVPASGNTTDSARVAGFLHDDFAFQDGAGGSPYASSVAHMVANCIQNFATTNNTWVRMSVPFNYSGPATTVQYLLITFATNKTPGGGSDNDYLYIDDVQLIYNPVPAGLNELNGSAIRCGFDENSLHLIGVENLSGTVKVYTTNGQLVASSPLAGDVPFSANAGLYLVVVETAEGIVTQKVYKR